MKSCSGRKLSETRRGRLWQRRSTRWVLGAGHGWYPRFAQATCDDGQMALARGVGGLLIVVVHRLPFVKLFPLWVFAQCSMLLRWLPSKWRCSRRKTSGPAHSRPLWRRGARCLPVGGCLLQCCSLGVLAALLLRSTRQFSIKILTNFLVDPRGSRGGAGRRGSRGGPVQGGAGGCTGGRGGGARGSRGEQVERGWWLGVAAGAVAWVGSLGSSCTQNLWHC